MGGNYQKREKQKVEIAGAISEDAYYKMEMETRLDGDTDRTRKNLPGGASDADTDRVTNSSL